MASTAHHQFQSLSPKFSERSTPSQLSGASNLFDADVNQRWAQMDALSSSSSPQSEVARLKTLTADGGEVEKRASTRGGKLHRRVASDSTFQTSHQRHPSFPSDNYTPPLSPGADSKRPTRIKPLLKKLTNSEGSNSLDLSRSATDQEGLGIYALDYATSDRSAADVPFTSATKRGGYHARSASGTSVYSNLTSSSRPGGQYVHPMRQTPRPYTPPNAHSYNNSILGSEHSGDGAHEDEDQIRRIVREASYRPHNTSSTTTPPLRLQTNVSSTRLVHGSQTNLAASSPSIRANGDARDSPDIMTPTSPKSAFKIRKTDPIMQAESIQAAREAFDAKEREKELKVEKEERRAAERETRKREREQERRHKAEANSQAKIKRSMPSSEKSEGLAGQEYANLGPSEVLPTSKPGPKSHRRKNSTSAKGNVQSVWVGFMVWLKLRFIKLGRKIGF